MKLPAINLAAETHNNAETSKLKSSASNSAPCHGLQQVHLSLRYDATVSAWQV